LNHRVKPSGGDELLEVVNSRLLCDPASKWRRIEGGIGPDMRMAVIGNLDLLFDQVPGATAGVSA